MCAPTGRAAANVVGSLCENNDWFAKARPLPADAAVGDLFVVHDTGAHGHSMGFNYNGALRAPELLLRCPRGSAQPVQAEAGAVAGPRRQRVDIIRRRETVELLYGTCVMPPDLPAALSASSES